MITFIIFLIILSVLVFIHELGHFLLAKKAGVKVEEFGFGYPPRAKIIGKKWGTIFSINWIPFGGFVKIFGEDYDNKEIPTEQKGELNFTQVSKKWQVAILAAGVSFNIIFAWLLFSFGFLIGLPTSTDNDFGLEVKNPTLTITSVLVGSPAEKAGLKSGDKINSISLSSGEVLQNLNPETAVGFISSSTVPINVKIERESKIFNFDVTPKDDLIENRKIIGISMDMVGTLRLPVHRAFIEGAKNTGRLVYLTTEGVIKLIKDAIVGKADISQMTGPVGIVGMVGDASRLGFAYLITFTALISINLAIINLVPFPALDGGRIVVVAIEGITRRKMNPKIISALNNVSFFLLIALMVVITYRDILKLF